MELTVPHTWHTMVLARLPRKVASTILRGAESLSKEGTAETDTDEWAEAREDKEGEEVDEEDEDDEVAASMLAGELCALSVTEVRGEEVKVGSLDVTVEGEEENVVVGAGGGEETETEEDGDKEESAGGVAGRAEAAGREGFTAPVVGAEGKGSIFALFFSSVSTPSSRQHSSSCESCWRKPLKRGAL